MDLTTNYLGLTLKSPLMVGPAAPLTEDLDNLKRLEDEGAAGVVLHSLYEEQIRQEKLELHHHLTYGTESFAEALTYFPEPEIFRQEVTQTVVTYLLTDRLFPRILDWNPVVFRDLRPAAVHTVAQIDSCTSRQHVFP